MFAEYSYSILLCLLFRIITLGVDIVAIKIVNLRKEYSDVVAVNNLNLEIFDGELFSLLGINGAGKTTDTRDLDMWTINEEI